MIDEDLTRRVGRAIRQQRHAREWTLQDLAALVPCSISYLSEVERGETPLTLARLARIAAALDTSLVGLLPPGTAPAGPVADPARDAQLRQLAALAASWCQLLTETLDLLINQGARP